MALPWLALIKAVPWTDVVAHAPTVLNAAKKLWQPKAAQSLGGAGQGAGQQGAGQGAPWSPDTRLAALEAQLVETQAQLADTNQLVKDMAEQQARMLVQIEDNRRALRRTTWLAGAAVLMALLGMWAPWSP